MKIVLTVIGAALVGAIVGNVLGLTQLMMQGPYGAAGSIIYDIVTMACGTAIWIAVGPNRE